MPKKTTSKHPEVSAGARYERAAFRNYLRRRIKQNEDTSEVITTELQEVLDWVLKRQERYRDNEGGL